MSVYASDHIFKLVKYRLDKKLMDMLEREAEYLGAEIHGASMFGDLPHANLINSDGWFMLYFIDGAWR